MAKKAKAAELVKRFVELKAEKDKLYAEQDEIISQLAKLPDAEVRKTGFRVKKAFEKSPVEYGHGPVREFSLVALTVKEKEAAV